jgi:hypothetical protein
VLQSSVTIQRAPLQTLKTGLVYVGADATSALQRETRRIRLISDAGMIRSRFAPPGTSRQR